ncbi:MAG: A24 family peptidase [bacterium]|nr:A24 family peptidase [bacterium]
MFAFDIFGLLYYFAFASLLIVIFVYDLKHKLIPDFATFGILILGLVRFAPIFYKLQATSYKLIAVDFLATFVAFVFFGSLWYFSGGRAMGFGDVKLAPALVLFLGASKGVLAMFLSFWIGAIVGIVLMLGKKAGWKSEIPFGPFLALGAFVALLWGEQLIEIYLNLMS